jgi:hypothetical protein
MCRDDPMNLFGFVPGSTLLSEPLSLVVRPTYVWVSRKRRIARPGKEGRLPAPRICFGSLVAIICGCAITLEPDS